MKLEIIFTGQCGVIQMNVYNYVSAAYIPALCIHCLQSCAVIVENAASTISSGSCITSASLSIFRSAPFTLEKASSMGLKSGEYGGK